MDLLAAQLYSPSLELIMLVIALLINLFLAAGVFLSNPRSATNAIFAILTVCTMFWLILTYISRVPGLFFDSLVLHRLGIFFAAPMSAAFFLLAHTMPSTTIRLSRKVYYSVIGSTLIMMVLNISPYAFVDIVVGNGIS
jgi:hypothetical protein